MNCSHAPLFGERHGSSFVFSKEISKPYGVIDFILTWCQQELIAEWRWEIIEQSNDICPGCYIFYFDAGRDACAFSLKWS